MNVQRRKFLTRSLSAAAGLGASAALTSMWRQPLMRASGVRPDGDGWDIPAYGIAL
jgi:hypothetical protein